MKKFALFSIFALFFGAFTAQKTDAQHYASRVLNTCSICKQPVYALYRPVNYNGCIRYAWVPVYHTACAARQRTINSHTIRHFTTPHYNYNHIVPSRSIYQYYTPGHYSHGCSSRYSGYSGYLRPGFSIRITR